MDHDIPCTRYEQPNETNGRVRETLAYASGAAGRPITVDEIISLHDHKGCLDVVWASRSAFNNLAHCVENAWERWGNESFVTHRLATIITIAEYGPGGARVAVS